MGFEFLVRGDKFDFLLREDNFGGPGDSWKLALTNSQEYPRIFIHNYVYLLFHLSIYKLYTIGRLYIITQIVLNTSKLLTR